MYLDSITSFRSSFEIVWRIIEHIVPLVRFSLLSVSTKLELDRNFQISNIEGTIRSLVDDTGANIRTERAAVSAVSVSGRSGYWYARVAATKLTVVETAWWLLRTISHGTHHTGCMLDDLAIRASKSIECSTPPVPETPFGFFNDPWISAHGRRLLSRHAT